MDVGRRHSQALEEMGTARLGEGDDRRRSVEQGGDVALEDLPGPGQGGGEDEGPHLLVDVMEPGHPRPTGPERREERHPVPDLDQPVTASVAAGQLRRDRTGEHQVAPGPPDHPVAVPVGLGRCSLGVGRPHGDVDAGVGPAARHLGDVHLGAPGLDVGEVAPGQDVDTAQPRLRREVPDLVDRRRGVEVRGEPGRLGELRHPGMLPAGLPRPRIDEHADARNGRGTGHRRGGPP